MFGNDDGTRTDFQSDAFTYAAYNGDAYITNCQERRPGGFWYESYFFEGKQPGDDLWDCGGLCCLYGADGSCGRDLSYGNAGDYPHGSGTGVAWTTQVAADQVDYCKAQGFSGCACTCFGKAEGEVVQIPSPPPPASSSGVFDNRVGSNTAVDLPLPQLVPPSPPHAPCADVAIDMASVVASCASESAKAGSNCTNVYDGVVGGYNSILTMGGDLARSWVASDVASARLTLRFGAPIDVNALRLTQRLYHGFDNQISSLSVVARGGAGTVGIASSVPVPLAQPPMQDLEAFTATVVLPRTYGGVTELEIHIDGAMDEDDAGIEELSLAHLCPQPDPAGVSPPVQPPQTPRPSPPSHPPAPPRVATVPGALTGRVLAATWHGGSGTADGSGEGRGAVECAVYCGKVSGADECSFYNASDAAPLPYGVAACECYGVDGWTVLDGRAVGSGFAHAKVIPSSSSFNFLFPVTVFLPPSGFRPVSDGIVVPYNKHLASSSAFELSAVIQPLSGVADSFGNVLRVAPWRHVGECRPCIDVSSGGVRAVYYTALAQSGGGGSWWKAAVASHPMVAGDRYTVQAELRHRRLYVRLFAGTETTGAQPVAEKSTGMALAGAFPPFERVAIYAGSSGAGGTALANVALDAQSVSYHSLVDSHLHFAFDFDDASDFLANSARFGVGFDGPPLTQGDADPLYAAASPHAVVQAPESGSGSGNNRSGFAASFDKRGMLLATTDDPALALDGVTNAGITACLWLYPNTPRDTLFTTLLSFGSSFALRFYAYFDDLSAMVDDADTRAHAVADGEIADSVWTHACASSAQGGKTVVYVDGERIGSSGLDAAGAVVAPPVEFDGPLSVGASSDLSVFNATGNDRGFGGLIDDVAVWGRQLSDAEIRDVHGRASRR